MRTILPGGEIKEMRSPGFTINRDLFDQALARRAEEAGAVLSLSTMALSRDGDGVLVRDKNGGLTRIKAKIIVGADGPHTKVGRWIGSVNRNMIPALQVSLPLTRPMDCAEVYFDKSFYGAYGWLFPKGREANVGIGKRAGGGRPDSMRSVLEGFISRLRKEGKIKGAPFREVSGWIPAEAPRKVNAGNILLAGDAAGHTHPITGAGVAQAVLCGRMAGRWAARAVESDDPGLLSEYDREWRDFIGESQERAFSRRQRLERDWDRLEETVKTCWVAFREYYASSE
jgi:flavin-dependent dehydrogenase